MTKNNKILITLAVAVLVLVICVGSCSPRTTRADTAVLVVTDIRFAALVIAGAQDTLDEGCFASLLPESVCNK